ncbi:MAG: hypothetical protein JW909_09035 [Planctomycetes bacterium]|nr:hypothetical protein [Planctomycetota bacterium]
MTADAERKEALRSIAEVLSAVGDSWRTVLVLSGLSRFAAAFLALTAAAGLAEAFVGLGTPLRLLFLFLAAGVFFGGGYVFLIRPMVRSFSPERCAEMLSGRAGRAGEDVLSAWQLESRPLGSRELIRWHTRRVAEKIGETDWLKAIDRAPMRRGVKLFGGAALAALPVILLLGPECMTAFRKMAKPFSFVRRAAKGIRIRTVSPGDSDILSGEDVLVKVTAWTDAPEMPPGRLFYASGQEPDEIKRVMTGRKLETGEVEYSYLVRSVTANTKYRVEVGKAQSDPYRLTIIPRPEIVKVKLRITRPRYTGLPPVEKEGPHGDFEALAGSSVYVTAYSNQDLASAEIAVEKAGGDPVKYPMELLGDLRSPRGRFDVTESTWYSVVLTNASNKTAAHPPRYRVTALKDVPPRVVFTAPGRDVVLPLGSDLAVALTVSDDVAVKSAAVCFRRGVEGEAIEEHRFEGLEGRREAALTAVLTFDSRRFAGGDVLTIFAVAEDAIQKGESAGFKVRIADPAAVREKTADWIEHVRKALQKILDVQKPMREETDRFSLAIPTRGQAAGFLEGLESTQLKVREDTISLLASLPEELTVLSGPRAFLDRISKVEETRLVSTSAELRRNYEALERDARAASTRSVVVQQDALIARIESYMGVLGKAVEEVKRDEREGGDLTPEARNSLKELKEKLEQFAEEQRRVIDTTADLAKFPVDDLTDEQKKELENLAAAEDSLKKFMEEAHADFSRLPEQDFSDPALLKELNEIVSDVELAADALDRKATEIAVPLEQAGLELAESLTTHIEKWLPDTLDKAKWMMEEPLTTPETPMAELPTELEDLIGELTQTEDDMSEENEDVTSSWTDSIDKGAGWGTADGPISNMSAQGVTGNRLPNTSEIGGRSGEGRTGKSVGELVEDSVTGKGGRRTPTRLSPDPYQEGQIKDESNDPAGGATGGGKVGGVGEDGLEGPPPPADQEWADQPLSGKVARIRNRSERIALELKIMNYPETEIDRIMSGVRALESDVRNGRYENIGKKRDVVLKGLKEAQEWVGTVKDAQVDMSALSAGLRGEVLDTAGEEFPDALQPVVDAYRKALLSGGR